MDEIRANQKTDLEALRIKQSLNKGKSPRFLKHKDGSLWFQHRLCVRNKVEIRKQILKEDQNTDT